MSNPDNYDPGQAFTHDQPHYEVTTLYQPSHMRNGKDYRINPKEGRYLRDIAAGRPNKGHRPSIMYFYNRYGESQTNVVLEQMRYEDKDRTHVEHLRKPVYNTQYKTAHPPVDVQANQKARDAKKRPRATALQNSIFDSARHAGSVNGVRHSNVVKANGDRVFTVDGVYAAVTCPEPAVMHQRMGHMRAQQPERRHHRWKDGGHIYLEQQVEKRFGFRQRADRPSTAIMA